MTKITIDIPTELYKKIELKRVNDDQKNKTVVINTVIKEYFEMTEDQ